MGWWVQEKRTYSRHSLWHFSYQDVLHFSTAGWAQVAHKWWREHIIHNLKMNHCYSALGYASHSLVTRYTAVNDSLFAGVHNDKGQLDGGVYSWWCLALLLNLSVPLNQMLECNLLGWKGNIIRWCVLHLCLDNNDKVLPSHTNESTAPSDTFIYIQ